MHKWRDPTPEDRRLPRSSDEVAELQRHAEIHPPHVGLFHSPPATSASNPLADTSLAKSSVVRRILELLGSFSLVATVAGVVTTNVLVIQNSRSKTDEIKVLRGQLEAFEKKVHSVDELNANAVRLSDQVNTLSARIDLLLQAAQASEAEKAVSRRDASRPPRKYAGRAGLGTSALPSSASAASVKQPTSAASDALSPREASRPPSALPAAEDPSPPSGKQPTPAASDEPSPREAGGALPAVPGAKDSSADSAKPSTPAPLGGAPSKEAPPSAAQADNG
jgi:hypothetical protein